MPETGVSRFSEFSAVDCRCWVPCSLSCTAFSLLPRTRVFALDWGGGGARPQTTRNTGAKQALLFSSVLSSGRAAFLTSVRQALSAKTSGLCSAGCKNTCIVPSKTRLTLPFPPLSLASLCGVEAFAPAPPCHPLPLPLPKTLSFTLPVRISPSLALFLLISWQLACGLLSRMKLYGLHPNVVSYGISMDACAKAGRWEKVKSPLAGTIYLLPKISSSAMLRDGDLSRQSNGRRTELPLLYS